jgi:hypothetical protein
LIIGTDSLGSLTVACSAATPTTPQIATADLTPITQPSKPSDLAFAEYAEKMRQLAVSWGDQAYGAVVVKDNGVVAVNHPLHHDK